MRDFEPQILLVSCITYGIAKLIFFAPEESCNYCIVLSEKKARMHGRAKRDDRLLGGS